MCSAHRGKKRASDLPEHGITAMSWCLELNPGPPEGQPAVLTIEQSLQPPENNLLRLKSSYMNKKSVLLVTQ